MRGKSEENYKLSSFVSENLKGITEKVMNTNNELENVSNSMEVQDTSIKEISEAITNISVGSSNVEMLVTEEIEKLDSSIISPEYQNNSIPLNMLLKFVNDKDIYENTKFKSRLSNGIYCGLSFICIAGIVYLFPVKNVENLSKLANILMPVITAVGLGGLFTQLPSLLRNSNPYLFLDKEISDFSKHILPSESGQMTIYRDLLNNLNKILDKEEGTPSVQNWLLDN